MWEGKQKSEATCPRRVINTIRTERITNEKNFNRNEDNKILWRKRRKVEIGEMKVYGEY